MPTTNPVPSTDPSDLLFNAGRLDEVVNGTANSFTDRLGVQRRTLIGLEAEFPNAAANAAAAAASAVDAADAAQIAQDEAAVAISQASAADASRVAAETARDAAMLSAGVYATTAAGLAATTNGGYFSVPSADSAEYLILYLNNAGAAVEVKRYPSASLVDAIDVRTVNLENAATDPSVMFAVVDQNGNAALEVKNDGIVTVPTLKSSSASITSVTSNAIISDDITSDTVSSNIVNSNILNSKEVTADSVDLPGGKFSGNALALGSFAITDQSGNATFFVREDGVVEIPGFQIPSSLSEWSDLKIGTDDTIVHIGDSYTAAHYVLKDKAYISQLSALSPYRHQNFGVSGDDALDMQYRIVNNSSYGGITFDQMKARYAFITTFTNDSQFRTVDLTYYAENVRRLIETVRAVGAEPVITTEFPVFSSDHTLLRRIADENGCAFIDCTILDAEVGRLQLGPFHQGHPGTRTGGVFWLPMLDFIDRMPKPDRAIKIFRKRSTFAAGSISDLLYKDRIDRNARWKELTVAHYSITPETKFEELSQLGVYGTDWGYSQQLDEYQKIAAGTSVSFADYALLEITLPGTATTLDAVEITLTATGSPTVYVRNFLDVPASMPGRREGSSPTDATYLSKWDKPRGAWRSLGVYSGAITIAQADLKYSMHGDKLVVMLAGSNFGVSGLNVRYKGRSVKSDLRTSAKPSVIGTDLITQPLCGTSAQLAAWTQTGTPSLVVPIDLYNAPRKLSSPANPVDGVCVISSTDTIGQTITLPSDGGRTRKYRLTAWVRYFPKAFLDPALYPGLDSAQVIDRIANPTSAPITSNTADLRTLKCEVWNAVSYPTAGGAEFFDFAALQWRPAEFIVEVPPYRTLSSLSFRLSCTDGEIQVAKTSFFEVI